MCLIEVNNSAKLIISCATKLINNIKIIIKTKRLYKARESILEFLLINHPLDCPICDQGGECDLQDISEVFGSDKGRYYEIDKRSILKKECGNLIEMEMTRCIHCTRCLRFLSEIGNFYNFGMLGRGYYSEISTYIKNNLYNELSGNIIDLCPVGALISKVNKGSNRY
jgi:NADH dehydrogenase/NADH:ubiquinone oxidoreductase subunit G